MKKQIYAIYDTKTDMYLGPFVFQTEGQATRWFEDVSVNPEEPIGAHPEDYTLCHVGIWNDTTAELTPVTIVTVSTALQAASRLNIKVKEEHTCDQ